MVKFYADLGKTAKKLLSDDYVTDRKVTVKTKTAQGVTFEVSELQSAKTGDLAGDVSIKYALKGAQFNTKLGTGGKISTEATIPNLSEGVKLVLNGAYTSSLSGTAKAEFVRDRAACTLLGDPTSGAVTATAAVGQDGIVVGAEAFFDGKAKELKGYNAAVSYSDGKEAEVTVTALDKFSKTKVSYSHNVRSDLTFAAEFLYKREGADKSLTIGGKYTVDKETTVKAKISSSGSLSLAYIQKLYPNATIKAATSINVGQVETATPQIGLQLAYEA